MQHNLHVTAPTLAPGSPEREIYALLFRTSAETLLEVARDPKRLLVMARSLLDGHWVYRDFHSV